LNASPALTVSLSGLIMLIPRATRVPAKCANATHAANRAPQYSDNSLPMRPTMREYRFHATERTRAGSEEPPARVIVRS
jgi:hypothetical protein